jgi:hypothetical protein
MTVPEITEDMLNEAKLWVGYSKNVFDEEIEQTMQACAIDLGNAGVVNIDFTDPLIKQAVKLYLKAQFRSDDGDNKFADAYEHLKKALSLSSDYNTEVQDG